MNIEEVRRKNVLKIIDEQSGGKTNDLAKAIRHNPPEISRRMNPDTTHYRKFGNLYRDLIEMAAYKPKGLLDENLAVPPAVAHISPKVVALLERWRGYLMSK